MAITDLSIVQGTVGPGKHLVDVTQASMTEDFTDARGFVVQMLAAGAIVVRTLDGTTDTTLSGLMAGDVVGGAGVPVICTAVRMTGTTANFRVVYL